MGPGDRRKNRQSARHYGTVAETLKCIRDHSVTQRSALEINAYPAITSAAHEAARLRSDWRVARRSRLASLLPPLLRARSGRGTGAERRSRPTVCRLIGVGL